MVVRSSRNTAQSSQQERISLLKSIKVICSKSLTIRKLLKGDVKNTYITPVFYAIILLLFNYGLSLGGIIIGKYKGMGKPIDISPSYFEFSLSYLEFSLAWLIFILLLSFLFASLCTTTKTFTPYIPTVFISSVSWGPIISILHTFIPRIMGFITGILALLFTFYLETSFNGEVIEIVDQRASIIFWVGCYISTILNLYGFIMISGESKKQ